MTARAELTALCTAALDWNHAEYRLPAPDAQLRPAAVLMLFGVLDDIPSRATGPVGRDLDVLLLRRAETLGSHAGQVAFPGGRIDPEDDGPVAGALREAVEETGLDPTGVDVLGVLPEIPLAVSRHLVTPVLGWWTRPSEVAAVDHAETVHVFRAPVADLLDPANRRTTVMHRGGQRWEGPGFAINGELVWGFTALVLDRLFDELGWTVPWDRSLELPL